MSNKSITVVVMAYNQRDYVKQCINSILDQQIDIDFDILIHDDCSDDGTHEILVNYQRQYPEKITIIHQESRKFLIDGFNMMIYKYVIPHVKSKYVAYCDGDDYWCDPLKLKKQYKFMESHPDYSMCFHNAFQLRTNNDMSSKWFIKDEGDINVSDLINDRPGVCVATSSIFLKSETFKDFSEWRKRFPVEDVPMYITAALHGKIHRLKDIMCVYRQFAVGSWSTQNKERQDRKIKHLKDLKEATTYFDICTDFKYHDLVIAQIERCDFRIAFLNRDFKTIFSIKYKRFLKRLPFKERISLKLQYKHPKLYNLLKRKRYYDSV